jgi:hypothetical protein
MVRFLKNAEGAAMSGGFCARAVVFNHLLRYEGENKKASARTGEVAQSPGVSKDPNSQV